MKMVKIFYRTEKKAKKGALKEETVQPTFYPKTEENVLQKKVTKSKHYKHTQLQEGRKILIFQICLVFILI